MDREIKEEWDDGKRYESSLSLSLSLSDCTGLKGSSASALGEVHGSGQGPSAARRLDFTPPRDTMRAGADRLSASEYGSLTD